MRAAKVLAVLAIAALGIGSFSAVAQADRFKPGDGIRQRPRPEPPTGPLKTTVAICVWTIDGHSCKSHGSFYEQDIMGLGGLTDPGDQNPNFDKSGLVSVEGAVNVPQASGDAPFHRSMSLQLLNRNGVVLTKLDSSTSGWSGGYTLSGQLPKRLPAGTNYVRVKAKKQANNGKKLLPVLAGLSRKVAIPAA